MHFKKWVKSIQTEGYIGALTVFISYLVLLNIALGEMWGENRYYFGNLLSFQQQLVSSQLEINCMVLLSSEAE